MTDRELLEAAAKAAGLDGVWWEMYPGDWWLDMPPNGPDSPRKVWRPLKDDGDALRLAVVLNIDLCFGNDKVCAAQDHQRYTNRADGAATDEDRHAATRRAIVRAAAALAA